MKLEHPTLSLSLSLSFTSCTVAMLLTDEEEAEGENEISLIVPRAVAKLVKHFAATLSPLAFSHVISFHVCGAN